MTTEADYRVVVDLLSRIVATMNCCDEEFCLSHDCDQTTDEDWDEIIHEAEDLLDEIEAEEMERVPHGGA